MEGKKILDQCERIVVSWAKIKRRADGDKKHNPIREGTLHNRVRSSTGARPLRGPRQSIKSIMSMRLENLQGRRYSISAPRVHKRESEARNGSVLARNPRPH
jgi:hypothetical protein